MEIREINKKKFSPASESDRLKIKSMLEKMKKEGEKLIKGMFEFNDAGGGWLDFSYRFFPGEPIRTVKIYHGEIVDIPMILAKHLNNTYQKIRKLPDNLDANASVVTKKSRCRFTPFEMLTEDLIKAV